MCDVTTNVVAMSQHWYFFVHLSLADVETLEIRCRDIEVNVMTLSTRCRDIELMSRHFSFATWC